MRSIRGFCVLALLSSMSSLTPARADYQLTKHEIQKVSATGGSVTCGLIGKAWKPVSKQGHEYRLVAKPTSTEKNSCAKLLKTGSLKNLAQIPSFSSISAISQKARDLAIIPRSVSGAVPALVDIGDLGPENVFWRPGIVSAITGGSPTQDQCNEFSSASTDGTSAGLFGCFQAQGVAQGFANMLQSGSSLCIMQHAPTKANLLAGGVSLESGKFPNNDISQLFVPGDADRTVKVAADQDGQQQIIYIKIFSSAHNAATGNQYHYLLWQCETGSDTPDHLEDTSIALSGAVTSNSSDDQDDNQNQTTVTGFLTGSGSQISFDTTQPRFVNTLDANDQGTFNSEIEISGDLLYTKQYQDQGNGNFSKSYSVAEIAGDSFSNLQLLQAAYKDTHSFSGSPGTALIAMEYRDSFYASAPENELIPDLAAVDTTSDPFYNLAPAFTFSAEGHTCSSHADVAITFDTTNTAVADSIQGCQTINGSALQFCNQDQTITTAQNDALSECFGQQ